MREGRGRAALGLAFLAWSLLTVFREPTYHLWLFALVATEWGHWLFAGALLTLAPGWTRSPGGRLGAAFGTVAAVLFLSPLVRAERGFGDAGRLDARLAAAFGPAVPRSAAGAPARPVPLAFPDLWRGVDSPKVLESEEVYARNCGDRLALQLYRPANASGKLPVVVVVHGGSWQSGSRLEMPELSRYLAARGYAVASIDYGLAPRSVFPGPVDDLRDALAFLRANAARWSLDPDRVALIGRSAGAQIALAAPVADEPVRGLRGIVDFYGPNDMRLAWTVPGPRRILDSRRLLVQYLGGSPAQEPGRYDEASPLYRAGKDYPPTLMIHGGRDELVWPLHQYRLSARLSAVGAPHEFIDLPWATHGCDYAFSGPCGQVATYAVERFLARVLL